ncbi:MAG TPA: HAD-IA family hydrolase [Candidatus Saccharimonadales bacterium]|nr:HAD-IA family hydrolase [Candidatus Saccharimonadales bacterium]
MIKAVVFDFYGVVSIRRHQAFLESAIPDRQSLANIYELRRQRDLGMVTPDEYMAEVSRVTGQSLEEVAVHMRDERVLNQPLIAVINDLHNTYKIGLLSNAASDLHTTLAHAQLTKLFDDVIVSAEVGMVKPDPHIFELACDRLEVQPHEAVMVDDLPENCEAAQAAGWAAVCYHTFAQCEAEIQRILAT